MFQYLKTDATTEMSYNQEPYHYSSHYSNSGIVLHFLVRLPPFTNMFLSYQVILMIHKLLVFYICKLYLTSAYCVISNIIIYLILLFINFQDNNFDWPDRTFHSLHTTWRLTSSESATDVKELIPEFYFLPEFLCNTEHFDFGTSKRGEIVLDVLLPPWASTPRLFVLIHR